MVQSLQSIVSNFVSGDAGQGPAYDLGGPRRPQGPKHRVQIDFHDRQDPVLCKPRQSEGRAVASRRIEPHHHPDGLLTAGYEFPTRQQDQELSLKTGGHSRIQPHAVLDAQPRRLGSGSGRRKPKGQQELCGSGSFHSPMINQIATIL
jgi:hypothetical protein